jgi:ABC-type Co2+ transport system permease subunit
MLKKLVQNEPAALAGAFIAIQAVVKAFLRWGGIDVPAELDTSLQVAIAAWVGLFVRSRVAPTEGPQNAAVKEMAESLQLDQKLEK